MDALTFIPRIRAAGFTVEVMDGSLAIAPASRLTDPQRQWIRDHKAELLAAITAANDGPLMVEAWTPAGNRMMVEARDQEHAAWIQRMNPAPRRST